MPTLEGKAFRAAASPAERGRWVAVLFAFGVALLAVGRPLWDPGRVLVAAGEASAHLPWRAVLDEPLRAPPRPDLSDQAMAFYPAYRFVSESLRAGDLPLWNPLVHAGAPCLANPQWGVLDPQVLVLVALDAIGGKAAFDWGFALTAFLRLGVAAWGTWVLARSLGLGLGGAALASAGYALSGASLAWVGFSVGHVSPLLPWILAAIERVRRGATAGATGWIGLAGALAILGGHPESAFFTLLAAAAWACIGRRTDWRVRARALGGLAAGVLASAIVMLPFAEYLAHSAALEAHRAATAAAGVDLVALGLVLVLAGLVLAFAGRASELSPAQAALTAAGFVVAVVAATMVLASRGMPEGWPAMLVHDVYGSPDREGGYRGPASFGEVTSTWLPTILSVLALAAVSCHEARVRRKSTLALLGIGALALASGMPALAGVWRELPLVGGAATARAAPVGALCIALLAGAAVGAAPLRARAASAAVVGVWIAIPFLQGAPEPLAPELRVRDDREELVRVLEPPPEVLASGRLVVAGWVHPALDADSARLVLVPLDEDGAERAGRLEVPVALDRARPSADPDAPEGAASFASDHVQAKRLREGSWRVDLVLEREERGVVVPIGARTLGTTCVRRERDASRAALVLALLALAAAALPIAAGARVALALAVVLAQGVHYSLGAMGWTPSEEVFPETRTAEILRARAGFARVLGGPGVLPYDTGIAHGLRMLDGYDALDVARFDAFRPYAMRPGKHPILDWNARGVDVASPAFALLGAHWLALAEPLDAPGPASARGGDARASQPLDENPSSSVELGPRAAASSGETSAGSGASERDETAAIAAEWELVAGPRDAPEPAECFLYRARDPLPRAFCVGAIVPREDVLADPRAFDPRAAAFLDEGRDLSLAEPFTRASAEIVELVNDRVRVRAELDGDGVLVLTEQSFPGWEVEVDGEPREIVTVDALFRGVVLARGEHDVVFHYRPRSFLAGALVALAGWAWIAASFVRARARRAREAFAPHGASPRDAHEEDHA